jgi:hypothetical protein
MRGRLAMDVRVPGSRRGGRSVIVDRRAGANTVLQSGASLVAELFTGRQATPVNGMGVGTNPQPSAPPYEAVTLDTNDEAGQPLQGPVAVALVPDDIVVEALPDELRVRVAVRGVIPPEGARSADGGPVAIGEAALGLLAADGLSLERIYNRVTFDPVPKEPEHELALYWEVFFPYGP